MPTLHFLARETFQLDTHILIILKEDLEVSVLAEDRMGREPLKEDFVHLNGLLKHSQVLSGRGTQMSINRINLISGYKTMLTGIK